MSTPPQSETPATPAPSEPPVGAGTPTPQRIAIVGGGIAGLFCAYALDRLGHTVVVFESSKVLGGRIRSFRFNPELLNDIERTSDESRAPIAHKAILQNALLTTDEAGQPKTVSAKDYDKREWDHLEFNAEFGPMRIELDVQKMLSFLIDHLDIPELNAKPRDATDPYGLVHMQGFPAFSSPASEGDPIYELKPEEEGKSPLDLLKLGLCRAVVDLTFDTTTTPLSEAADEDKDPNTITDPDAKRYYAFRKTHNDLITKLGKAAATQRPAMPVFESWVRHQIHEDDLWVIQRHGRIPVLYGAEEYINLHTMGFWNLMAAYLSHNAVAKVRDLGSFYHLIPENPNAAEWLTWWLRQVSISGQLQGIFGGMQTLVEKLVTTMGINIPEHDLANGHQISDPLEAESGRLKIYRKATVTALDATKKEKKIAIAVKDRKDDPEDPFDRVILALPTVPAEKLIQRSKLWSDTNLDHEKLAEKLAYHLHSALPFSLLKVFFIVRDRWWEEPVRANPDVSRYPTREVYFWKSRMKDSRRGMVMLYMDRPTASFWANYVPKPTQPDIDELCRPEDEKDTAEAKAVKILRARIKSRFVEYVNDVVGKTVIKPDDIIWCGIMDWGREPYGAASHAWRPNRDYWNTLAALTDWPLGASTADPCAHLHVCGEAYSDYHAFIEGSLRSAVHVLTQIPSANQAWPQGDTKAALGHILKETLGRNDDITDAIGKEDKPSPPSASDEEQKAWDERKYVKDFHDFSAELNRLKSDAQKPE